MNQQKTGAFLQRLRKEKGLTQEQLAERFYVSSRTVSRWETGSNMPDVGTLIELADFYDVDIREIIDGERKGEIMDKEMKDTLKKVDAYRKAKDLNQKIKSAAFLAGICVLALFVWMLFYMDHNGTLNDLFPSLSVMIGLAAIVGSFVVPFIWISAFQEKPSDEPERTITATVVSKEVIPGAHGAGRSKGGYSYVADFRTEDGQTMRLFAYEEEFGALKPGMTGTLTYKGRYFVDFE